MPGRTPISRYRFFVGFLSLLLLGLPPTLMPFNSVSADDSGNYGGYPGQPAAGRFELDIKTVHIYDDRDWEGQGEIRLDARIWQMKRIPECPHWTNAKNCIIELAKLTVRFPASGGANVPITRTLPDDGPGSWMLDADPPITPRIGVPVFAGEVYGWEISAVDEDLIEDDYMGWLRGEMSEANGWGIPGEYTERGWVVCDDPDTFGFCIPGTVTSPFNPPDGKPAHFNVQYELRRTPLPDLVTRNFRYDAARDAVCMTVQNIGELPSGQFRVTFRVDNSNTFSGWERELAWNGLAVNESREQCLAPQVPAGEHYASFVIDEDFLLAEMDDRNNFMRGAFDFVGPQSVAQAAPTPTPQPTGPADLSVQGFQVKSNNAGAGPGCIAGRNDITARIMNGGASNATNFVVRLEVEGGDNEEKTVAALEAGKSVDVTFDDVQLRRGMRELKVIADAKNAVTESNEGNNRDEIQVNCRDDD